MRLAICLSGLTRSHQNSLISIREYFSKYDCDIYCHAYKINDIGKLLATSYNQKQTIEYYTSLTKTIEDIVSEFNPKAQIIENYDELHENFVAAFVYFLSTPGMKTHEPKPSLISMYNGISKVKSLIDNHNQYDFIIKMRYDSLITSMAKLETYNKSMLHIPSGKDWAGINDQFAFGNPVLMMKYMSLGDELFNLIMKSKIYHPEMLLDQHLKDVGLSCHINRPEMDVLIGHEVC